MGPIDLSLVRPGPPSDSSEPTFIHLSHRRELLDRWAHGAHLLSSDRTRLEKQRSVRMATSLMGSRSTINFASSLMNLARHQVGAPLPWNETKLVGPSNNSRARYWTWEDGPGSLNIIVARLLDVEPLLVTEAGTWRGHSAALELPTAKVLVPVRCSRRQLLTEGPHFTDRDRYGPGNVKGSLYEVIDL